VRWLIVAVEVVGVAIGAFIEINRLRHMSAKFRSRAEEHAAVEQSLRWVIATSGANSPIDISPGPGLRSKRYTARAAAEHEAMLARKYFRAARYPWLPVAPDPPEPE